MINESHGMFSFLAWLSVIWGSAGVENLSELFTGCFGGVEGVLRNFKINEIWENCGIA